MSTIKTKDGTEIYYKDWGPRNAQPIMFHHGWPLSSDDWDTQMLYFVGKGFRVVAHDRRGDGRSSQVSDGHDMDHYAADAAAVVEHLDLRNAIHIGHSTGGGQAARYVARHGKGRVAKLVLIGAVPPIMVKTPTNPGGLPIEVFDGFRKQLAANRAQFYLDIASGPFYGFNRAGAKISQGVIQNWWRQAMMGSAKAQYDCIKAFSETDFTEDLKSIDVPTLVMHGDDDQIVPIADSALLSAKLLKKSTLKVYPGFPHGMCTTHQDVINRDLLEFVQPTQQNLRIAARVQEHSGENRKETNMKIVVIGGTGLIGSKLVTWLREGGHEAVAASPKSGVNTLTGEGLAEVLKGAAVVVDVSNSPSWEDAAVMNFFETSTGNLLKYGAAAGVKHLVALSVVGTNRLSESGYFRAKIVQEKLIKGGKIPYSIVEATQFFEFLKQLADISFDGKKVRVPDALFQPMAADDVASAVGRIAIGPPINGTVEIGGPKSFRLDELVRRQLTSLNDSREVVADPNARYSGAKIDERTLVPDKNARLGETRFETWLKQSTGQTPSKKAQTAAKAAAATR